MKNIVFIVGVLIIPVTQGYAQEGYSLQQCIDYALENAPSIKNADLEYEIARSKVKETTAIGLPQINGGWDVNYNPSIQQNFVPNDPNSPFFNPMLAEGESMAFGLGTNYSSNLNATATQLIFDGSYIVGLQAAKVYTELAEKGIAQSKVDIAVNVQKAYYMVLITQERSKQLLENEKMLEQLLEDTKALAEAGFAESTDAKRVSVNLNNLDAELQKLKSFEQISLNMLKFQMGMPVGENITLSEDIKTVQTSMTSSNVNFENRPELEMIEVQSSLNELNVKNEKVSLLPSLTAFGRFGINYGTNSLGDIAQFDKYKDYGVIGVSLNVPIWSSGQRKFKIQQAKAEAQKTQNNKEQLLNSFELEASQAGTNLENNQSILKVREENMELAEEVFEHAKLKYNEGVGSSFEVTSAQNDLKVAQTEYYNALYDVIISQIDLDKANGNIVVNE